MKKNIILTILFSMVVTLIWAQQTEKTRIPLIGEMTPEFVAQTTMGQMNFPGDYPMKWKIIFSHPADFTSVCSSELLELATMQDEFKKLNTHIMVLSTDGLSSHLAWVKSLETISHLGNKPMKIQFPLIPDTDLKISKQFGMIHHYTSVTRDVRGVFIIDPNDRIAAIFFYPMNVGRNMDEVKRTLLALQTSDKYNVMTPVNWNPGDKVMIPGPLNEQEAEKMKLKLKNQKGITSPVWYMWYKELPSD